MVSKHKSLRIMLFVLMHIELIISDSFQSLSKTQLQIIWILTIALFI